MSRTSIVHRQLCRECINVQTGARLIPRDCRYWHYPAPCSCCGEIRHIVTGVTLTGRWKLFRSRLME
ncbi:MAG: hypothetical protein IJO45_02270 [Oscillospiraceae bacterium]|nr:hypothetical protein [Oscillospiraceae bacterium]